MAMYSKNKKYCFNTKFYLQGSGAKAKARIQKTMQRMVESRDLVNGSVYGTYKIFTHLPVKEDLVSTENEVIN